MSRVSASLTIAALLFATLMAQTPAVQAPALDRYVLPAEVTFPEGIAYDPARGVVYTASALTGALVRLDLKTRQSEVVTAPGVLVPTGSTTFPGALGMKLDAANRLWVAGGRLGRMFLIDAGTGRIVKQFEVPTPAGEPHQRRRVDWHDRLLHGYPDADALACRSSRRSGVGDLEPWLRFDRDRPAIRRRPPT